GGLKSCSAADSCKVCYPFGSRHGRPLRLDSERFRSSPRIYRLARGKLSVRKPGVVTGEEVPCPASSAVSSSLFWAARRWRGPSRRAHSHPAQGRASAFWVHSASERNFNGLLRF